MQSTAERRTGDKSYLVSIDTGTSVMTARLEITAGLLEKPHYAIWSSDVREDPPHPEISFNKVESGAHRRVHPGAEYLARPWRIRGFASTRATNWLWRHAIVTPRGATSQWCSSGSVWYSRGGAASRTMEDSDSLAGTYSRATHRVRVYRTRTLAKLPIEVLVTMATGSETKNDCCWRPAASYCSAENNQPRVGNHIRVLTVSRWARKQRSLRC
jgi:ribosomal 50S subunit-recycling heat shock protein